VLGDEIIQLNIDQEAEALLKAELTKASTSERRTLIEKFVLAALGSIPWIGGFISAAAAFKAGGSKLRPPAHAMAGGTRPETPRFAGDPRAHRESF
jgi:hypothetical protein